jgi:DNA-binding CsgD family transcriptional regulator
MDFDPRTATALMAALRLAREHGGAAAALRASGIDLPETERFGGLSSDIGKLLRASGVNESVVEALALGFLAGQVAPARRDRAADDPTSFVMDRELLVQGAEGQSIMRLPWFEDDLFVGRQLPDISEMPVQVRTLCIENYSAALEGERGRFAFTSYGHAYSVEAVPVHGETGEVDAVLAVATPDRSYASAATAYERTADRLERSVQQAEDRAEKYRAAGRDDLEAAERLAAQKARAGAERARFNAQRLRRRDEPGALSDAPSLTPREMEVLSLASHGLTYAEIAEQLAVSPTTIRTHLENIYPKLGVSDKAAAVAAALRHGLIE